MKRQKLNFDELLQEVEQLKKTESLTITGGREYAKKEVTYDGGTLDEVTITPNGGGGSDNGTSFPGFYGNTSGGMDYGTGYVGGGDSSFGGGGGGEGGGSTYTTSHTLTHRSQDLFLLTVTNTLQQGILAGTEGESMTINHNVIDGHYDGYDITKGPLTVSFGVKGSLSLGIGIGNTIYSITPGGFNNNAAITTVTNNGGVVTTFIREFDVNAINSISSALVAYGTQELVPAFESALESFTNIAETVGIP